MILAKTDNSREIQIAKKYQVKLIYEAFADRNYNDDLTLVSRVYPYATITDKVKVLEHIKRMVETSEVKTVQDNKIFIKATTFCVHGDNAKVVEILEYLNEKI